MTTIKLWWGHDDEEDDDNKDTDTDVCMVPIEREEEDVLVLLSFVWFPSDNTLFIAPDMDY